MLHKFNLSEEKGSRSVRQLLVEQLPSVGLNVFGTNMSIRFHVIWFVTLVICLFELTTLNVILKVSGKRYFRDSLDTCIQLTPVTYSPECLSQKFLWNSQKYTFIIRSCYYAKKDSILGAFLFVLRSFSKQYISSANNDCMCWRSQYNFSSHGLSLESFHQ